MIEVSRSNIRIQANPQKVVARYLKYGGEERIRRIVSAVLSMEDGAADVSPITPSRKLLLGSYFTHEYSVESAALFNPSIVNHPDQNGLDSDYSITFEKGTLLGNRVIFPVSPDESNGMEDVRFVEFSDLGQSTYVETYTAYDGRQIKSKIIETRDFTTFNIRALTGKAIAGKGMALFSENLYSWNQYKPIQFPERDWELIQLDNLIIPYAMSDSAIGFAMVGVQELIDELVNS